MNGGLTLTSGQIWNQDTSGKHKKGEGQLHTVQICKSPSTSCIQPDKQMEVSPRHWLTEVTKVVCGMYEKICNKDTSLEFALKVKRVKIKAKHWPQVQTKMLFKAVVSLIMVAYSFSEHTLLLGWLYNPRCRRFLWHTCVRSTQLNKAYLWFIFQQC